MTADEPIIYGEKPAPERLTHVLSSSEGKLSVHSTDSSGLEQKRTTRDSMQTCIMQTEPKTASPNAGTDRFVLGRSNPDVTLGWNNTITYKNWDFNMFCNAAFGAKRLNIALPQ